MDFHDDGSHQHGDDDKLFEKTEKTSNSHAELREDSDEPKADDDEGTREKPTHECEFCGKKFNSGKALSGHRRFHQRKEKEDANKANNNLNISGDKFSCCICMKDFPSKRSLCGHMRSHSDRNWKGIHPPPPLSSPSHHKHTSFSSLEENKDYDHFSVVVAQDEGPLIDYSEDETKAAQILVSLSHDTWPCGEYHELPQVERSEKNVRALNSMSIEDIPSTSGVKDHVSHFNATEVVKNNNKKRRLIVKLKNPYLESKDETPDDYQGNI